MNAAPKYRLSPTTLDAYTRYGSSDETWLKYWGNSETPAKTPEEHERECFDNLINKINRAPIPWEESENADRGTAFNEIVDCIVSGKNSTKMAITRDKASDLIIAAYNNRTYSFPVPLCREFADYYRGAVPQVYCEAILPTRHGDVLLLGYADEVLDDTVHDIKTCKRYDAGQYRHGAQHLAYPYCLSRMGYTITAFEYNVARLNETKHGIKYDTFTEHYPVTPGDESRLRALVEEFIDFLEHYRPLVTDHKIFNVTREP
jgi:hypothetical protein